jgi:hypothetical protein
MRPVAMVAVRSRYLIMVAGPRPWSGRAGEYRDTATKTWSTRPRLFQTS